MITIIHGEDTVASRNFLYSQKQQVSNSLTVSEFDATDLAQIFLGGGLFEETKIVFVENFLSKTNKSKSLEPLVAQYIDYGKTHDIFFWEGQEVPAKILSRFKDSKILHFPLPKVLFQFLDAVRPNNGKQLVTLYKKACQTTEFELIFHMLVRQTRILLSLKDPAVEPIDEIKRLAPWQKEKMKRQAKTFSTEQLFSLHKKLYKIDRQQKIGSGSIPISTIVDFLLVSL